jgi:deoxyhypusine synthase
MYPMDTMKQRSPVQPTNNVADLLRGMSVTGFQGRKLGETVEVWSRMIRDRDCTILMGLSGAMIPAGMQRCIIELIERRYIDVIVSTGANVFHDACEHLGVRHYLGHHTADDTALFKEGIDRIYDVFAYENEFRDVDRFIAAFGDEITPFRGSSCKFIRLLGERLIREKPEASSFIASATHNDVPIFVPALCDSSIGIGLVIARRRGVSVDIDQIGDTDELTRIVEKSRRTGVVYIGGGVPKNFIQQTQVIASIHEENLGGHDYAVQITTDAPHWGGLSGCTFDEAISWGKEAPAAPRVQCFCDATIALPIVTSALIGRGEQREKR